jgi:hypothetical protein
MPALETAQEKEEIESIKSEGNASVEDQLGSDTVVITENETSSSNSQSNNNNAEDTDSPVKNPSSAEIYALASIFLGPMISEYSPEELQDIITSLGEKITDILIVSAVLLKVAGADQNPRYQELISSSNNNAEEN